jgi:hypothetical protein
VVGAVLLDEKAHGRFRRRRVDAVELDRAGVSDSWCVMRRIVVALRSTRARVVIISLT